MLKQAEDFIAQLFHTYLEARDFAGMLLMLHPQISWFGTGAHEVCRSYNDAVALLEAEKKSWDGCFKILDIWMTSCPAGQDAYLVYGEMKVVEDGADAIPVTLSSRFSMVCTKHEGRLKLCHGHYSVPNAAQNEDEFIHKELIDNYNRLLENKLQERTRLLKQRSQELERLTNNIAGGLQRCAFDERFTIAYVSDGFLELLGLGHDRRSDLLGSSHLALVHPADVEQHKTQLLRQLESADAYSTVYRIVRSDGSLRWVLDNGSRYGDAGEMPQIQRILTDITAQKRQEEELRVSQKRYDVALRQMDVSMFEYNIETQQLTLFERDASLYGLPTVIEDGPRVLAESGYFDPACVPGYLEMYRKVCSGEEAQAQCYITASDVDGKFHEFELSLTAVLDETGAPIRAIGVKKSTLHLRKLQREQAFGKTLTGGKRFLCEVDITNDQILRMDAAWRRQMRLPNTTHFFACLQHAVREYMGGELAAYLTERMSSERITALLAQDRHLDYITFPWEDPATGQQTWNEITLNVIRDTERGNICLRIYHEDISQRKQRERQAEEERRLYEHILDNKAILAYEVNISRDQALRGHEHWQAQYGIVSSNGYSEMIEAFAVQGADPHDSVVFLEMFRREYVLRAFYDGERKLACQYRRRDAKNGLLWVECTMHLFEDPENGDIRGYSYVENIDKQKKAELELRYKAEHDAHTDLYNKETTAERIGRYLQSDEGKKGVHAFLMVDMDHFKSINDSFGHLFGDGVIAETGARIRAVFHDNDIIGRIGGDEFCVFMKQVPDSACVEARAEQLCRALTCSYGDGAKRCTISASVGVALYPANGRSYEDLYRHADSALYDAKRNGRNRHAMAEQKN